MIKRTEFRRSIQAKDAQGKTYRLDKFVDVIGAGTMNDKNAERDGLGTIKTEAGQHVNVKGKGQYEIVESGTLLTSDDPDAF